MLQKMPNLSKQHEQRMDVFLHLNLIVT